LPAWKFGFELVSAREVRFKKMLGDSNFEFFFLPTVYMDAVVGLADSGCESMKLQSVRV